MYVADGLVSEIESKIPVRTDKVGIEPNPKTLGKIGKGH
jgi:hypothetical protein